VKAAEKLSSAEGDRLLDYLKDPVKTTTLVFMSPKLDGRLRFTQALTRTAVTVDCAPLREMQMHSWVTGDAQQVGVRLGEEAAQVLKEASGGSLYAVRRELEKLASYVPPDRAVTAADVLAVRGMEPGASVFDLTVAIGEGNRGRALSILARNLDAGEAPLRILGSLAWQYRRLWKVNELLANGGREGEAARTLRMDPRKVRPFLARFSVVHLQRALQLFLDVDGHLKGGGGGQPKMALERLLLQLCEYAACSAPTPPRRPSSQSGRVSPRIVPNVRTIRKGNSTGR
jgi:DNA polymerase-3 subunit delta